MQREAAGIATETPTISRVAEDMVKVCQSYRSRKKLTDIAPYRCPINGVSAPYDGVDEQVETSYSSPYHV